MLHFRKRVDELLEVKQTSRTRGDLSEAAWQRIAPLLPPENDPRKRGERYKDHRTVINGILWILRTGAPWRDLPECYGPYQTCYDRLARWQKNGLWQQILEALQGEADSGRLPGQEVQWEGCALDSTSIKAHPHAAGARKAPAKKGAVACARRPVARTRKVWDAAEEG